MAGQSTPTILSGATTLAGTYAQLEAAEDAKNISKINALNTQRVAKHNAIIANRAAGQKEAASQIAARESRRQGRLMESRVLALAAASGGGAMDNDVMNAIAGFAQEGDLSARTDLYEGSEEARTLRAQGEMGIYDANVAAANILYEGEVKASKYKSAALGTFLSGATSMATKYYEDE